MTPSGAHSVQRRLRIPGAGPVSGNLVARLLALAALTCSSLIVARTLGPAGIGAFSLLRVLPWLTGVLLSGGLYGSAPYFLSGRTREEAAYRATFPAIAITAGLIGALIWMALAPALHNLLLPQLSTLLLMAAGITVFTQLLETTAKTCSQGVGDLAGSNRIIVLEEALFPLLYLLLLRTGIGDYSAMVAALAAGDILTATQGWLRLFRRGFFARSKPSFTHARAIVSYGIRAELGSIALLLNGRLDFVIIAALAGPAPLGVYAVASRYSELLRLPGLAMNYVLYPAYTALGPDKARANTVAALRRLGWVPAAVAVPMAVVAPLVLPTAFGSEFRPAVVPAWVLLLGLSGCGISGILTAYLYASGRPGRVSGAQGLGLVVTVILDVLLIPRFGTTGAAVASTIAYLATTLLLYGFFRSIQNRLPNLAGGSAGAHRSPSSSEEVLT
jgi:O-antigen/teichoic acid export membrane protein